MQILIPFYAQMYPLDRDWLSSLIDHLKIPMLSRQQFRALTYQLGLPGSCGCYSNTSRAVAVECYLLLKV